MKNTAPHYLLITEAKTIIDPREDEQATSRRSGHWRFVLEQMGVDARIEVADDEPNVIGERLELLAVVRGLESLEQPSRVTLLTSSRYVGRGIRQGMSQWRSNQWRWERFGKMTLIKNHDLWRRVDHALLYHSLECRIWDLSRLTPHASAASAKKSFHSLGTPSSVSFHHHRRRTNVIRPHGDDMATDRKPIMPLDFADRTNPTSRSGASSSRPEIVLVGDTGSTVAKKSKPESPETETSTPALGTQRKKQQPSGCIHPTHNNMARVKPPRAGRAYGYAVN
jgi:ribonuclease HI